MKIETFNKKQEETQKEATIENFVNIEEPENFHVITTYDDLVIDSKETMDALLNNLNNVKYNENLAKFIFNFMRDKIKDLTEE